MVFQGQKAGELVAVEFVLALGDVLGQDEIDEGGGLVVGAGDDASAEGRLARRACGSGCGTCWGCNRCAVTRSAEKE